MQTKTKGQTRRKTNKPHAINDGLEQPHANRASRTQARLLGKLPQLDHA